MQQQQQPPQYRLLSKSKKFPDNRFLTIAGTLLGISWTLIAIKVLSYHPDPHFAHCSLQHNLWTMAQALAFPLCALIAAVRDVANCWKSLVVASVVLYLATARMVPTFAFGMNLIPPPLKVLSGASCFAMIVAAIRSRPPSQRWLLRTTTTTPLSLIHI